MRTTLRASSIAVMLAVACVEADDGGAAATEESSAAGSTSATVTTSTGSPDEGKTAESGSFGDTTVGDETASAATTEGDDTTGGAPSHPWEDGSIRVLPAIEVDLVEHVLSLEHPNDGDYAVLDAERQASFEAFLAGLDAALALALSDPEAADWCRVLGLAEAAGYEIHRLRDTATGRWFVYGADATAGGQAYFFVNPEAKRDLVVEVPHHPFDGNTSQEGARLLVSLSARALLLAKEHRCSDPDDAQCPANTTACGGSYRESDVAHDPRNTFHVLHAWYVENGESRFVQLHGFDAPDGDLAEIGDGTNNDVDRRSIANVFAEHLGTLVGDPSAVFSCQAQVGAPPAAMCGGSNVQAHATHAPRADACPSTGDGTNRFLHVEQSATLRDEDEGDQASWTDVRDALALTWPDCTLGAGPRDCDLGPPQGTPRTCACGQACR